MLHLFHDSMHAVTVLFLISGATLALIHSVALQLSLYWYVWWLDIPVHILGGAVVALGVFAVRQLGVPFPKRWLCLTCVLSFVLIAALVWEIYDAHITVHQEGDFIDTAIDIVMGMVGGVVGYTLGKRYSDVS